MRPFQGKVVRWCRILSINSIRHEALIEQAASPNFEQRKHPDLESCPKGTTLIQHFKKHAHEKHVSQMIN